MADEEQAAIRKGHTPPYIAYQSLKTMLAAVKTGGLPDRLDRSVLTNFSGAVGGQIITSLRFLRLIDGDGRPKPEFEALISAYSTDQWPAVWGARIREAYAPLFEINLESASPMQFNERFRAAFPSKEETLRKCITFFLSAVREADIPISSYIMKNKKPRTAPARRRATRPAEQRVQDGGAQPPPDNNQQSSNGRDISPARTDYDVLIAILDPSKMDENEMAAVWTLIRFLKRKEASE